MTHEWKKNYVSMQMRMLNRLLPSAFFFASLDLPVYHNRQGNGIMIHEWKKNFVGMQMRRMLNRLLFTAFLHASVDLSVYNNSAKMYNKRCN